MMYRTLIQIISYLILIGLTNVNAQSLFSADDERIQYFGRWDHSNKLEPSHSWPGAYIYAEFEGTSIGARFSDNYNYYNIYIDGELNNIFHGTVSGENDYSLVTGLPDIQHTIRISKRNETAWTSQSFTFFGFILDDGKTLLEPIEKPERKIEFIGDSFTSASGNESPTQEAPDDMPKYTNIDEGFGPIIAKYYGAQYHMTSISGFGLVLDYQSNFAYNIPDRFNRTHIQKNNPIWDFEQWIPNLVVIGLGLNDYSGFDGYEGTVEQSETDLYKTEYHEFIATIRDIYPGVKILAVAAHVGWMQKTIKEVVNEEISMGNTDVKYAQYSYYDGGYVNVGHPSVETHHAIADELITYIDEMDPWEPYNDTKPPIITSYPNTSFVSYNTNIEINVTTDSYSTVKYDFSDKSFDDMEFQFNVTGKRNHFLEFLGEHGKVYNLYIKASDVSGNITPEASSVIFKIDTSKILLNWNDLNYDDSEWNIGQAKFGLQGAIGTITFVDDVTTVYFRKVINIQYPENISSLGLLVKGTDAAAAYLNGVEIGRVNFIGDGNLEYSTYAKQSAELNKMFVINDSVVINNLKSGENLVAIEVHKALESNNGTSFDTQLINQNYQVIYPLGSEWLYYDDGFKPESQIIDKITDLKQELLKPAEFSLNQNYPNPFNPTTKISFSIDKKLELSLAIYNSLGEKVEQLIDATYNSGSFEIEWNAKEYSSGIYFYQLSSGNKIISKKCIILK